MPAINVHYRVTKGSTVNNTREAAEVARTRLLREWAPVHWHLESVAETGANLEPAYRGFSVSFTVVLDDVGQGHWNGDG